MGFSINKVILAGNITQEPELKYTQSGKAVLNFNMATSYSRKNGDDYEDVSTFHKIVVWGKIAEWLANNLAKGEKVTVMGRIDNRSWDKPDGTKGYISEVVADDVIPMSGKKNSINQTTRQSEQSGEEDQSISAGAEDIDLDSIDFDLDPTTTFDGGLPLEDLDSAGEKKTKTKKK